MTFPLRFRLEEGVIRCGLVAARFDVQSRQRQGRPFLLGQATLAHRITRPKHFFSQSYAALCNEQQFFTMNPVARRWQTLEMGRGPLKQASSPVQISPTEMVEGHGNLDKPLEKISDRPLRSQPGRLPNFVSFKELTAIECDDSPLKPPLLFFVHSLTLKGRPAPSPGHAWLCRFREHRSPRKASGNLMRGKACRQAR